MKQRMIVYSSFRNKRYIIYTSLITLLFILCYIFHVNYNFYNYQINEVIGEKEANRGLLLFYRENIEDFINNMDCIDNYMPVYNNIDVNIDEHLYKINTNLKKNIIYGRNIENNNEVIVSAIYFRTLGLNESEIGNIFLKLTINNKSYDFNIVGVTDDNHAHFYLTNSTFENIFNANPVAYYLLIDSYPHVSNVIQKAKEQNDNIEYFDSGSLYEIEELQKSKTTYIYLYVIITICITLFYIYIIKHIFITDLKNICLYKAIGFKNNSIKKIIIKRIIIIITFSIFILLILSLILSLIINKSYISIKSNINAIGIIYIFSILIAYFLGFLLLKKLRNINIIENLKK